MSIAAPPLFQPTSTRVTRTRFVCCFMALHEYSIRISSWCIPYDSSARFGQPRRVFLMCGCDLFACVSSLKGMLSSSQVFTLNDISPVHLAFLMSSSHLLANEYAHAHALTVARAPNFIRRHRGGGVGCSMSETQRGSALLSSSTQHLLPAALLVHLCFLHQHSCTRFYTDRIVSVFALPHRRRARGRIGAATQCASHLARRVYSLRVHVCNRCPISFSSITCRSRRSWRTCRLDFGLGMYTRTSGRW